VRGPVEAVLFAAGRPVSADDIAKAVNRKRDAVDACLRSLLDEYASRRGGIEIARVGNDQFVMQVRSMYFEYAKKVSSGLPISRGASKTLSVIAAEQPIAQSVMIQIRGRHSYKHVKELVKAGYVEARKAGRTSILTTTQRFNRLLGCRDAKSVKKEMELLLRREQNATGASPSERAKSERAGRTAGEDIDRQANPDKQV